MAVPKRRHSSTRRDKRRTNWVLKAPLLGRCAHCNQPVMPHRVCPHCGYYKGVAVLRKDLED